MQDLKPSRMPLRLLSLVQRVIVDAALVAVMIQPAHAEDKEVTDRVSAIVDPWVVAIANGSIEKATGYKINWRQLSRARKSRPRWLPAT